MTVSSDNKEVIQQKRWRLKFWKTRPIAEETVTERNGRRDTNRLQTSGVIGLAIGLAIAGSTAALPFLAGVGSMILSGYIFYRATKKHWEAAYAREIVRQSAASAPRQLQEQEQPQEPP